MHIINNLETMNIWTTRIRVFNLPDKVYALSASMLSFLTENIIQNTSSHSQCSLTLIIPLIFAIYISSSTFPFLKYQHIFSTVDVLFLLHILEALQPSWGHGLFNQLVLCISGNWFAECSSRYTSSIHLPLPTFLFVPNFASSIVRGTSLCPFWLHALPNSNCLTSPSCSPLFHLLHVIRSKNFLEISLIYMNIFSRSCSLKHVNLIIG